MRLNILRLLTFIGFAFTAVSCLDGDDMNTPPGGNGAFLIMTNNESGGPLVNSGLRYFGNQSLLLDPTVDNDTMTFAVALEGVESLDRDVNVTLVTPEDLLDDYYYGDSIEYAMLPEAGFTLLSTSAVIPKGKSYAEFKVVFHPSQIDLSQNYMLPLTVTNDANLIVSSNYGAVYYHIIGNPLAGLYTWHYRRYNNADTVGATSGTLDDIALFAPKDGTTVETSGGYASTVGLNAPYIITFTNTDGVLSDFKVTIDPDLVGGLTENGITITKNPIFVKATVTPTSKYFKIMYQVFNGTANRTLIDEYSMP